MPGILWLMFSGLLITDLGNEINLLIVIFFNSFYKLYRVCLVHIACADKDIKEEREQTCVAFLVKTEDHCRVL